ncbi:metallophosphoesterase [Bacillus sp. FJAT-45066]|uniref:metallophosphoesterase n=1 Tax=Bacillus sp. FJAT-45066 TaxID=2011010 RepID=UPI001596566C|nr:metallophosphoesterase [Bacillus sp. FJAT-45066]
MQLLIFFSFLLIYLALNFYVAYNGWVWLKRSFNFRFKKTYFLVIFVISISFFLTEMFSIPGFRWVGYIWLVMFGYSLLLFPLLNFIYFLNKKRGIKWFGFSAIAFYLFIFTYGSYNMWSPVVVTYDIEIEKESELDELKILLVSDIHINETIGPKSINRLINLSKEVGPDIIFLAGDVIDNSIEPYYKHNLSEIMSGLTAPMGVYAVLGNHEYYGNDIPIFIKEMNEINIEVLVDEITSIDDLFYVVGRKDYSDRDRASIHELTNELDPTKPIFLIDHQPREYSEISAAGVDLMVSGHTHKGQLFPANFITNAMYENHHGHLQVDQLHTIVSSGFGIWGPPFRIGSRSEVMEINVRFVN